MKEDIMKNTQEKLTIEELIDLKIEAENLIENIDELIEECDEALNS